VSNGHEYFWLNVAHLGISEGNMVTQQQAPEMVEDVQGYEQNLKW